MGRMPGNTGWVRWPALDGDPWRGGGEGGMWVTAFVLADYSVRETVPYFDDSVPAEQQQYYTAERDPFVRCHGPDQTICLPRPDSVVSPNAADLYDRWWDDDKAPDRDTDPEGHTIAVYDSGVPVLAALVLGTSGHVPIDRDGNYWHAIPDDLALPGHALWVVLRQLYDREPILLTYLDT